MTDYPNWFDITGRPLFEKYLTPMIGQDRLAFLQLGVFTGDASRWLLDNILTGKYTTLVDVDTWGGSSGEAVHSGFNWQDVEAVYDMKVSNYPNVKKIKTSTRSFNVPPNAFHFAYIDAEHTAEATYLDGILAWKGIRSNGLLAFDDYEWTHPSNDPELSPKPGINKFLEEHKDQLEILEKSSQVWVRKL